MLASRKRPRSGGSNATRPARTDARTRCQRDRARLEPAASAPPPTGRPETGPPSVSPPQLPGSTEAPSDSNGSTIVAALARRLAVALVLGACVVSLLLAVPPLRGVARQIGRMSPFWIVAAVALEMGSCLGFVVIFRRFFDSLPAGVAREMAWIETGSGALLPGGGVGALAVGGVLLRRLGVSLRTVVERSSGLFFLTSGVNVVALVGTGTLLATSSVPGPHDLARTAIPIVGGIAATGAVLLIPVMMRRAPHRRWPAWLGDLTDGIDDAVSQLTAPSWRLLGAVGYLGLDIAALGAAFAATGRSVPFAALVLGYLIGYLANLIPIPGGFGVLEGGLAGTLIAYGTPPTQTAAAVVVYHAIAFWIPSVGGVLGFALFRRRAARAEPHPRPRDLPSARAEPVDRELQVPAPVKAGTGMSHSRA